MAKPKDLTHSLWSRVLAIQNKVGGGNIPEFGLFVDTHRDLPHIGTFESDMHRGKCKIVQVAYDPDTDCYLNPETGTVLNRHPKHMFVDPDWWMSYLLDAMTQGLDPTDDKGQISTAVLRDPRAKRYHLWSFRQVVMHRYMKS